MDNTAGLFCGKICSNFADGIEVVPSCLCSLQDLSLHRSRTVENGADVLHSLRLGDFVLPNNNMVCDYLLQAAWRIDDNECVSVGITKVLGLIGMWCLQSLDHGQ